VKFGIDKVILWSRKDQKRTVAFRRSAVNVITGDSGTGKTAILDLFDYCFLASTHNISESVINEKVGWYGLTFYINDKTFTLARRAPNASFVSSDYYFSALADEPDAPVPNIAEDDLRRILETEFGIVKQATIPFGGAAIRAGSKISFRYFFLFNTVSQNIITNSEVFFDRQSQDRYREALPRVFDMALGIDDIDNIDKRELRDRLERELAQIERKERLISERFETFKAETTHIARQAIEYGLVGEDRLANPLVAIREALVAGTAPPQDSWFKTFEQLTSKLHLINRQLRNARRFGNEYKQYKSSTLAAEDSLKPLSILIERSEEVVKTESFDELIASLKADLIQIKRATAKKTPIDAQLQELVHLYEGERHKIEQELAALPEAPRSFQSEREKWIFIGEAKGKLEVFEEPAVAASTRSYADRISSIQSQIAGLAVHNVDERRELTIRMLEEAAQTLMTSVKQSLENYADYHTVFNYKTKKLQLRKPKSNFIENVGSSSNHMFLHLFQFLALHDVALSANSRFVPSFLVLDQPSRPYYGDDQVQRKDMSHSDTAKITSAFGMLDRFIDHVESEHGTEFQMIVLEHVPPRIWKGMKNVVLVEEFSNGNALVPSSW
jgi:hypothetical protein